MASPSMLQTLGAVLIAPGGAETPLGDVLEGEEGLVALLFAAEWAPNFRSVAEQLSQYVTPREDKCHSKVVLVSSDEDEAAFARALLTAPFHAVPFVDVQRRLRLLRHYRVTNLPFLVVLESKTGRCVSRVSSENLLKDPECSKFPWKSRCLVDILSTVEVVDPEGGAVPFDHLKGGMIALYFSANWCPPCKAFTPQLIHTYNAIKSRGFKFEVLFVSSDRSEDSWKAYHSSMPWPGIQWMALGVREELAEALDVKGIPTLVLLDSDLSVISREGRSLVNEDPEAQEFPWRPQSVESLKYFHMPAILERPTLILFTDGEPSELQFGKDVLLPAAEEYFSEHSEDAGMSLKFFVAGEDEISDGIRDLANLDDVVPLLAIIDLAVGDKFLLEKGVEISNAAVHNFVTRYTNGELEPIPLNHEESDPIYNEDDEEGEEEEGEETEENRRTEKTTVVAESASSSQS